VQTPRLLVIGDIAWDILVRPQTDLVWGSDVFGAVELMPGGSAANVAVWARRLGADVTLVGKIGDDVLGEVMLRHLASEGLSGEIRTVPGGFTTRVGVVVAAHGEHAFVTDHTRLLDFSAGELRQSLLDQVDAIFFNGYGVFTSGSAAFMADLLQEARRRGLLIAFDPSSFALIRAYGPARLLDEAGHLDLLMANDDEVRALSEGRPVTTLSTRASLVVIKQGADGATAVASDGPVQAAPVPVVIVDTTGAGDGFDAAFLVEFLRHRDISRALRAANRLGSHVAGSLGAQPPTPDWMSDLR
jgi:ribokinase